MTGEDDFHRHQIDAPKIDAPKIDAPKIDAPIEIAVTSGQLGGPASVEFEEIRS